MAAATTIAGTAVITTISIVLRLRREGGASKADRPHDPPKVLIHHFSIKNLVNK